MNNPKVSVLVPSLNVAKYIEQCMQSIVDQTLRDIEIICIDAGSTDGTVEILERFAKDDKRIHLIHSDRKSYGYQMNLGLAAASGDYIGIIETDDFAELNMFKDLYTVAVKNNADLVMSNFYSYCSATETNKTEDRLWFASIKKGILTREEKDKAILTGPAIWANLYSHKMLKDFGVVFVESPGASYQDTAFSIKSIIAAKSIAITSKPYYHYRTDNENSSVRSSGKVFCVCDEMADVEKFVEGSSFDERPLWEILWKKKIGTYNWNIDRLAKEPGLDFVNSASIEFANATPIDIFKASMFDDCRSDINLLISDPKLYLLTRPFIDFEEMSQGEDELTILKAENYRLSYENEELKKTNKQIKESTTFKVGKIVLAIPKKIKQIIR